MGFLAGGLTLLCVGGLFWGDIPSKLQWLFPEPDQEAVLFPQPTATTLVLNPAIHQTSPLATAPSLNAQTYFERGNGAFHRGSFQNAIANYSEAISLKPNQHLYHAKRGQAYQFLGYPEQAVKDYVIAIRLEPQSFRVDGAYLEAADLAFTNLKEIQLNGANLRGANLQGAYLRATKLEGADLSRANLEDVDLWQAALKGANLRGANLHKAYLSEADLRGADLRETDLRETYLKGADLRLAYLQGAKIDWKTEFDAKWRLVWQILNQHDVPFDLRNQNLQEANLIGADLRNLNLTGVDLRGAIYDETTLWPAGFKLTQVENKE